MNVDQGLVAHYGFNGDSRDYSGSQNHGRSCNVDFTAPKRNGKPGAARFNGRDACIEVRHRDSLRFGTGDFSIAVWVRVERDRDDVIGDLLSKFNDKARRGLNLSMGASSGGYNSCGDPRQVYFGIDNGMEEPWQDCGKPWPSNTYVTPLTVYEGNLYMGLGDAIGDPRDACHVFRYAGGSQWEDCGRVAKSLLIPSAYCFIVHKGELYCGTGYQDWTRMRRGDCDFAHVYKYAGGKKWTDCGQPGENYRVLSLASFKGELYCGTDSENPADGPRSGKAFRHAGGQEWADCGRLGKQTSVFSLMVHDGRLYGGTNGEVFRYEGGDEWTYVGNPCHNGQVHCLQVYRGKLYAGTWPQGYVCRYEGGTDWSNCGTLGRVIRTSGRKLGPLNEINELTVYNGKLYAGVIPKGEVYRYEGAQDWTMTRRLVSDPGWSPQIFDSWARVPSMTVYQGRLFAGTGSCRGYAEENPHFEFGRVYSWMAGKVVSYDRDIGDGWKHIAAIRDGGVLKLYVSGRLVSSSTRFRDECYDLANEEPLYIGFGALDYFSGVMDELRIYNRALSEEEVTSLAEEAAH